MVLVGVTKVNSPRVERAISLKDFRKLAVFILAWKLIGRTNRVASMSGTPVSPEV
jgi:hypothetical protein